MNFSIMVKKIECCICHARFDIPQNGFKSNMQIRSIIDSSIYLSEREKTQKLNLEENVEKIANDLSEFEIKYNELKKASSYHFLNIRRDIEIQHQKLTQQSTFQKEELIKNVNSFENYYTNNMIEVLKAKQAKRIAENKTQSISEIF